MKLEVGKLYSCKEYHLLFYPDQETAAAAAEIRRTSASASASAASASTASAATAVRMAALWSNRLGKPVSYAEKNIPLLVLNDKKEYIEVLAGDRKGWIIDQDWLEIKEIEHA